ncbi:protein of unknown function [Burkholderia multivorans]
MIGANEMRQSAASWHSRRTIPMSRRIKFLGWLSVLGTASLWVVEFALHTWLWH